LSIISQYVETNKGAENDWFRLESNKEGTRWFGKCWHVQNMLKYEFDVEFDVRTDYRLFKNYIPHSY
jgi:ufm1-conjugating enzyme 1